MHIPTRGRNPWNYAYTKIPRRYKALPHPHSGQSDHIFLHLLPTYSQLIKRVKPSVKTVKMWAVLQDCVECAYWQIFRNTTTQENHINLEKYASSVTSYIRKCVDHVVIMKTISSQPESLDEWWDESSMESQKKLPFTKVMSTQHWQSKTESWQQRGKEKASAETGERPQHE